MLREFVFDGAPIPLNIAEGPQNGPLLFLFHGFTNRWQTFLPILPALTRTWQVIAFDHRGHGSSGRDPDGYDAAGFYRDAESVLAHFATAPAVLLGHSMGGSMALHLAQAYPQKVRAVITGDTSINLPIHIEVMNNRRNTKLFGLRRRLAGQLYAGLLQRGLAPEQALEMSQLDPAVMDYHAEGHVERFFADTPGLDFSRINCPVLLTQANPDKGGLLQNAELSQQVLNLPNVSFVRFDCGHDLEIESGPASPFFEAAVKFLQGL